MRARRHTAAIAGLTAALLSLVACGDGERDEPGSEPSSDASSGSNEAAPPSDQPAEGEEVEVGDFVQDMKSGLEASTTAQMSMEMDAGGAGLSAEGEVDYTTDPASMDLTMQSPAMGAQQMELRLVDGVIYINMGQMSNGKFVSYDLSDTANLPPGMQGLQQQMDPLAAFEDFEEALTSVTYEGTEEVGGEQLSHYEAVIDPTEIKSLQGVPAQAGMPKELSYDLWFDEEFRARRVSTTIEAGTPLEMDVELSEWGSAVDITTPPPADVVDGTTISG